jgi:hypothetical protein
VGDSVCTTTLNFGRGVTSSLIQAQEALHLVDEHPNANGVDAITLGEAFDAWCEQ